VEKWICKALARSLKKKMKKDETSSVINQLLALREPRASSQMIVAAKKPQISKPEKYDGERTTPFRPWLQQVMGYFKYYEDFFTTDDARIE
jgi:hypothetical protein